MVEAVAAIGRKQGMRVVAEQVDNCELLMALRDMGIEYMQGYLLSEPRPFDDLLA